MPEWFDENQQLRPDLIVAWGYWYSDRTSWVSLRDPHPAPNKDVQMQRVWALRPDGKRDQETGRLMLYCGNYTRGTYIDPRSGDTYVGDWTGWQDHDTICNEAKAYVIELP
jgi:hypothetical protein